MPPFSPPPISSGDGSQKTERPCNRSPVRRPPLHTPLSPRSPQAASDGRTAHHAEETEGLRRRLSEAEAARDAAVAEVASAPPDSIVPPDRSPFPRRDHIFCQGDAGLVGGRGEKIFTGPSFVINLVSCMRWICFDVSRNNSHCVCAFTSSAPSLIYSPSPNKDPSPGAHWMTARHNGT